MMMLRYCLIILLTYLFDVGESVLVKYDDGLYPGEVREVGDREVKVCAMIKSESTTNGLLQKTASFIQSIMSS